MIVTGIPNNKTCDSIHLHSSLHLQSFDQIPRVAYAIASLFFFLFGMQFRYIILYFSLEHSQLQLNWCVCVFVMHFIQVCYHYSYFFHCCSCCCCGGCNFHIIFSYLLLPLSFSLFLSSFMFAYSSSSLNFLLLFKCVFFCSSFVIVVQF